MEQYQETIKINDSISNEEALIIIRLVEEKVGICLSLENDGDVEVFLNTSNCKNLINKLNTALELANDFKRD